MSWKPVVQTEEDGEFYDRDGLRFATQAEAERAALSLADYCMAIIDWDVWPSNDPINASIPVT